MVRKQLEKADFLTSFNSYLCDSIPQIIVNILSAAGYDNAISIADITETDIDIIETYATENLQSVLEESKTYVKVKPFAFLPGHKKLLLGLPDKIHSFKNKKCRKNLFSTSRKETLSEDRKEEENQPVEFIELLRNDEISALKDKLLKKLNGHLQSISIVESFSENHIIGEIEAYISQSRSAIKQHKLAYKCKVKCVLCEINKPCTHVTHWQISNLEKHLKEHSNLDSNITSKNVANSLSNKNAHKDNSSNSTSQAELDDVLNSGSESD